MEYLSDRYALLPIGVDLHPSWGVTLARKGTAREVPGIHRPS